MCCRVLIVVPFFFHDPATTEIYTLSLHDALPIWDTAWATQALEPGSYVLVCWIPSADGAPHILKGDRKSTRLNSSHANISYAVFCLKKKKHKETIAPLKSQRAHVQMKTYTGAL